MKVGGGRPVERTQSRNTPLLSKTTPLGSTTERTRSAYGFAAGWPRRVLNDNVPQYDLAGLGVEDVRQAFDGAPGPILWCKYGDWAGIATLSWN